jgi:hypothetical protein
MVFTFRLVVEGVVVGWVRLVIVGEVKPSSWRGRGVVVG